MWIVFSIPYRVKKWMRASPFLISSADKVDQGIYIVGCNIRILSKIELGEKEFARIPSFERSPAKVVA
jgi:hypothetical protein